MLKNGEAPLAIDIFNEILSHKEDSALAHYHLANAYMSMQEWEKAENCLDVVTGLDPEWPYGFYQAGKVATLRGFSDDAVGFFSTALKLGIDRRQGLIARGLALYECGRLAEAIDDFDAVLVEAVDITSLQYRMACLLGMHRYQEALADIEVLIGQQGKTDDLIEIRDVCRQQVQAAPAGERIRIVELHDECATC